MTRKVIVSCAVTGSAPTVGKHPAIPVTPEQIARAAIEAGEAGATIAHIHVRDPNTGLPSGELHLYREVVERIRASGSEILINLTTGYGGRLNPDLDRPDLRGQGSTFMSPEARIAHIVELRPEICTLDVATMNMGENAFVNVPKHLRVMAEGIRAAGVKPELEVFDVGHLRLTNQLIQEGLIEAPPLVQVVLGVAWGLPAETEAMAYMRRLMPEGAVWAAFGISRFEFPMVAQAVLLGGHVRVGLEDNIYISRGEYARDNAQLVERAVDILRLLDGEPASPAEARQMLNLRPER